MNVDANQIRGRTDDGVLDCAGFRWSQPIARRETFLNRVFVAGQIMFWPTFPIFLFWGRHGYHPLTHIYDRVWLSIFVMGVGLMLTPFVVWILNFSWMTEVAAIMFASDGTIYISKRRKLIQKRSRLGWYYHHRKVWEISSIERVSCVNNGGGHYRHGGEDGYYAYDVLIHFTSGERRYVAYNLDDEDSHIVVTQLNIARREISAANALAA